MRFFYNLFFDPPVPQILVDLDEPFT